MHELANALTIRRYSLTRLVDRPKQKGLVEHTRSSGDGRGAYATIPREEFALRRRMGKVYENAVEQLCLSQFSTDKQSTFSAALYRVAAKGAALTALRTNARRALACRCTPAQCACGVSRCRKTGILFPSLAHRYHSQTNPLPGYPGDARAQDYLLSRRTVDPR